MARSIVEAPPRRLVPIGDAADYISVTRRTLERAINRGELKAYKLGKRCTRVDLVELEDLMLRQGAVRAVRCATCEQVEADVLAAAAEMGIDISPTVEG